MKIYAQRRPEAPKIPVKDGPAITDLKWRETRQVDKDHEIKIDGEFYLVTDPFTLRFRTGVEGLKEKMIG